MGVIPIELGPFTEGVNLVDPATKLTLHEVRQCKNFRIGVRGDLEKRPGFNEYGSTPQEIGANRVNLLLRYYKSDGSRLLIGASAGLLKFGNDSTGAWTNISINGTGASMGSNLADWMVYKNRLYITDGTNPQRYNGTDDIYAGHFVHAAPTTAETTGGALTLLGVYKYKVASVAGDMGEGIAGAEATRALTGANNQINLSVMAAAPAKHEETFKRIYRTKAGGTLFYFLAQIATGTTTYNDQLADTALSEEYIPVHAPHTDCRFVIVGHDDRTYWFGRSGVNASLVDVSDVGFPDRIVDTANFSVANNDGDIVTGGGLVPGGIVFFKRNSCWLLRAYGFGLINIHPREKRGAGIGTLSHFSIVTTPAGLIFLSQRGEIYLFDGTNLREIGRKVASEFDDMSTNSFTKVISCYHDYRYIISYDFRNQHGHNWRTLEYDTRVDKWEGPHENPAYYTPSYYSVWDSALDKGELYWGEAQTAVGGFVYGRNELSKLDRGNKFVSIIQTGALSLAGLGEVISTKAFVHGEFSTDTSLVFSHIDERKIKTSVSLNTPVLTTSAKWDSGVQWGIDAQGGKWGGLSSQVVEGSLGPCRSRVPIYEITDGGTATSIKMNLFQLLAEGLPLK